MLAQKDELDELLEKDKTDELQEQKQPPKLLELLSSLSSNLGLLLTKQGYEEWAIQHLELLLECVRLNQWELLELKLQEDPIIKEILRRTLQVKEYVSPQSVYPFEDDRERILGCYEKALKMFERLCLSDKEIEKKLNIGLSQLETKRININKRSKSRSFPVVSAPNLEKACETLLKKYHGYCREASRAGNSIELTKFEQEISALEAKFLYQILLGKSGNTGTTWIKRYFTSITNGDYSKPIQVVRGIVSKLNCHLEKGIEYTDGILKLFIEIKSFACKELDILALAQEISDLVLGKKKIQACFDWKRYREELDGYRQEFREKLTPNTTLKCQGEFTKTIKKFTQTIIQDCVNLLGSIPAPFCFLALGSMSRGDMAPYSDVEYALLKSKTNNPEYEIYINALLALFKFKVSSIGEDSLSKEGEEAAGYHLDDVGGGFGGKQIGGVPPYLRFVGQPKELIDKCMPGYELYVPREPEGETVIIEITDDQSYSLYQADYLYGDKNLWKQYQEERDRFLDFSPNQQQSLQKPLHQKVAFADIKEVCKKVRSSDFRE